MIVARLNGTLRQLPAWWVYVLGLGLFLWIASDLVQGKLGVDPVKAVEWRLGKLALQFLLAGLAISPIRWATGLNLIRYRRAAGLTAFAFTLLHLLTWLLLDIQLRWSEIGADLLRRPYITIGMLAFVLMIPLAVTSNNLSVRRMGGVAWQRLHRLTYAVALAGAVHYMLVVKAWPIEPILYLAAMIGLLLVRLVRSMRRSAARAA